MFVGVLGVERFLDSESALQSSDITNLVTVFEGPENQQSFEDMVDECTKYIIYVLFGHVLQTYAIAVNKNVFTRVMKALQKNNSVLYEFACQVFNFNELLFNFNAIIKMKESGQPKAEIFVTLNNVIYRMNVDIDVYRLYYSMFDHRSLRSLKEVAQRYDFKQFKESQVYSKINFTSTDRVAKRSVNPFIKIFVKKGLTEFFRFCAVGLNVKIVNIKTDILSGLSRKLESDERPILSKSMRYCICNNFFKHLNAKLMLEKHLSEVSTMIIKMVESLSPPPEIKRLNSRNARVRNNASSAPSSNSSSAPSLNSTSANTPHMGTYLVFSPVVQQFSENKNVLLFLFRYINFFKAEASAEFQWALAEQAKSFDNSFASTFNNMNTTLAIDEVL